MTNINTEPISLPESAEKERKPLFPPVGSVLKIKPETSSKYGLYQWAVTGPFVKAISQATGKEIATSRAVPLDEKGVPIMEGGSLEFDQVEDIVDTLTREQVLKIVQTAGDLKYKLPADFHERSVNEAYELQALLDQESAQSTPGNS